jgi:hypothetical protein
MLVSSISSSGELGNILHLGDIAYVVVWIFVFGLLIHTSKIGDALFFRRNLSKSKHFKIIKESLSKLGWPSVVPLVDYVSEQVRQNLDRLDSIRIFCANCLFSSLIFFILVSSIISYEILINELSRNFGWLLALAVGIFLLSVLLYKQGVNYQHLEVVTLSYYLDKEVKSRK